MDIFATIGALFETFNFFFDYINQIYCENFQNDKVVQKILNSEDLSKRNITINKNIKPQTIELNIIDDNKVFLMNESNEKDNNNEKLNKQNIVGNSDKIFEENKNIVQYNNINLPKLSFFGFFFASICAKKRRKSKNQEIIEV